MTIITTRIIASVLFIIAPLGFAQTDEAGNSDWGLGIKVGTTGVGLEFTKALSDNWNFRLGYSDLSYDYDVDDNNLNYEGEISKNAGSLLIDWHPWGGNFRVSGGLYAHGDNKLDALALPTGGSFNFNGTAYATSSIDSVTGQIDMGSTAPYLGIGWGNAVKGNRLSFLVELGIQFQDTPDIAMAINNCSLTVAACNTLVTDLEAEILDIREDIDGLDNWPVLNIGLSYRF